MVRQILYLRYGAAYSQNGWPNINQRPLRVRFLVDPALFYYGQQLGSEVW